LFDMHQDRAKRYRSLLRLEASVLQGTVDRWGWQCMNMAFRGWRNVLRQKQRQEERASSFFQRWQIRTFVPRSIRSWARIAKVRLMLAAALDGDDGESNQLKLLYALQQRCKAQRVTAEGEFERLTLLDKKAALQLTAMRSREIVVSDHLAEMQNGRTDVARDWAAVVHLLFGDIHEVAALQSSGHQHGRLTTILEEMINAVSSSSLNRNGGRRRSTVSLFHPESSEVEPALLSSSVVAQKTASGDRRRQSVNLSDNAASLRKRAATRSNRLSTHHVISVLIRFAPNLREFVPRNGTGSGGAISREDIADIAILLLNRMVRALGPSSPQFPVRLTDLLQQDQNTLRMVIQEVWWVLCGGHCSLFLDEICMGPPKTMSLHDPKRRHTPPPQHAAAAASSTTSQPSIGSTPISLAMTPESHVALTPPIAHLHTVSPSEDSRAEPMLVFDQRQPFESALFFPAHRPTDKGIEAAWMVHDIQRGMDLLQPLEELYRSSNENWSRMAQQGEARAVHQLSQTLLGYFSLFYNQCPPPGIIDDAVRNIVRTRDWNKIAAVFPPPHKIHHSMDLVEYTQEVSNITGYPMKSILQWISASFDFDPMSKLFVAAASEDVTSIVNMNRDSLKVIMRQCSTMVLSSPMASSLSASRRFGGGSSGGGHRASHAPTKKLVVQREKFISTMMLQLGQLTTITEEQLDDAFTKTLAIRHGLPLPSAKGTVLPPLASLNADDDDDDHNSARSLQSSMLHMDEEGFTILLLFCAHFYDPDPFLTSAARMSRFLEFVSVSN
jgi:hypothetical protein